MEVGWAMLPQQQEEHDQEAHSYLCGRYFKPALRRAARYGDGWLIIIHLIEEIKGLAAELNVLRRESGREKEPFDTCRGDNATTVLATGAKLLRNRLLTRAPCRLA